ncbi:MAG: immunoglobulin domain-containing protein, partial [Ignavibacteriaceae bacterium]
MGKRVTVFLIFCTLFIFTTNLFAQAPVITQQPAWQGAIVGQTATFKVMASGDTLTYQWYKNGAIVSGATDSIYTTPAVSSTDNGSFYSVIVSNSSGSDTSKEAELIVTSASARVGANEIVEYTFKEGSGNDIHDVSGITPVVNLEIADTDKVAWSPNGLLTMSPVKIQSDTNTSKILDSCTATNELTIEAWIVPHDTIQSDANVVTYQGNYTSRRFSLIQNSRNYTVLTRIKPGTDNTGTPGIRTYNGDVELYLTQVVYTRSANDDSVKIYLNGQ